ncbi:MAG: RNA-binding domain-containing protein [Chloroflexota bacterium]
MEWRRIDLHLHTPASVDYQDPRATPLDLLRRAEEAGLDIIAFTDHNSVRGYADMWREIEDLELLEFLKRIEPKEQERLDEYRRLLRRVLVLPGFEFTATFGFHVLAIFPEGTSVRLMEHLLLLLGVPEDRFGSGEVGATSDVLRAYEVLADHGALVIGAHVNSSHGVAMQGLKFGGQTKIAYTQDEHLHALEVTDLNLGPHRRSTAKFFNGSKPEYPRRMHCIQGSDAHRLLRDLERETQLGIGDRPTEALLPEVSFAALKDLFLSEEFDRTRPFVPAPADPVKAARLDGNTAAQAFHESLSTKRTGVTHVLRDLVAFANGEGGVIIVGASAAEKRAVHGVGDADAAIAELRAGAARDITPAAPFEAEKIVSDGKPVLLVTVPPGPERPYALAPGAILVRKGGETVTASRDEIVAMVTGAAPVARRAAPAAPPSAGTGPSPAAPQPRATAPAVPVTSEAPPAPAAKPKQPSSPAPKTPAPLAGKAGSAPSQPPEAEARQAAVAPEPAKTAPRRSRGRKAKPAAAELAVEPTPAAPPAATGAGAAMTDAFPIVEEPAEADPIVPKSGVEVVASYERGGQRFYTLRDLKANTWALHVPKECERRLWRTAIAQHEEQAVDVSKVKWAGDFGLWKSYRPRGSERRYHLVHRGETGLRVFYGVSEAGMDGPWRALAPSATKES